MEISEAVKQLRKELCMEQKELGALCGVSVSSISGYEHGTRKPSRPVIKSLMELVKKHKLKFTLGDFLGD
jgi:transcriptional regulator with XRE-family HTH domain